MGGRGQSSMSGGALSETASAIKRMLQDRGIEVNDDNTVTLFHATSRENAESILRDGFRGTMAPISGGGVREEVGPRSFFGLDKKWVQDTWGGPSSVVMEVRVPVEYVRQGPGEGNKEVYIEGNVKRRGGNVWVPDVDPTSTFYDRMALKRYGKSR